MYGQGHETESLEKEARVVITNLPSKRELVSFYSVLHSTYFRSLTSKKLTSIHSIQDIMNSPKGKRTRFSIAKKVEILDLVKKGKSRVEICKEFGLAPSTLSTFLRDEKKVREEFENNRDSKRNAIRVSPHNELEQNLVKWVHIMRENKVSLSGPMVQEKAMGFAKAMNVTNFVASNGWLDLFKKREALN